MRISRQTFGISLAIISAGLVFGASLSTFAAGTSSGAAGATSAPSTGTPSEPRPDTGKKVWTNEDVIALGASYRGTDAPAPTTSASVQEIAVQATGAPAAESIGADVEINPEQDPRWYGDQVTLLDAELASIDREAQRLREFRATSSGLATGLVLNGACEGITTDNLLGQLVARRQQVLDQIDALGDTARMNGFEPGILVEGRGLVQTETQTTPEEQRAALKDEYQKRSDELVQTREALANLQAQAAARRITLLPTVPGEGGNMTTDLVQRLDDQAGALQSQISNIEGDARSAGVEPGELR